MGMKLVESLFLRIQILMAIIDYFCEETSAEVVEEVVSLGRRSWILSTFLSLSLVVMIFWGPENC